MDENTVSITPSLQYALQTGQTSIGCQCLIRFHQAIENQAVKRVVSGQKQPTQVKQALAAVAYFPAKPLEPGEFIRDRSGITAADG